MRGADFAASPTFEQVLARRLGDGAARRAEASRQRRALIDEVTGPGDAIAVPANASRDLVDDVKACGRRPRFVAVDEVGAAVVDPALDVAAVWIQTIAGVVPPLPTDEPDPVRLIDASDTVVDSMHPRIASFVLADDTTVSAQRSRRQQVAVGLTHAAGLPLIEARPVDGPVPSGVVVRLPAEADPITFVAYARAELTGIDWLPLRRPLHPQARQHLDTDQLARSADHLARLVIVPVGPTMADDEIGHAVLGITKTAEYTGWRWLTDPEQACWYAEWLVDRYGPDHEAYRPAFALAAR